MKDVLETKAVSNRSDFINTLSRKEAAIFYAKKGWRVHPLWPGKKTPITKWKQSATSDPAEVERIWTKYPKANIGIVTGGGGPIVLDVDVKNGDPGLQTLEELKPDNHQLTTLSCVTPSGGYHYYYVAREGEVYENPVGFRPGLDFRGDGAYIVAPPSNIGDHSYSWCECGGQIDTIPSWLETALTNRAAAPRAKSAPIPKVGATNTTAANQSAGAIAEGGRNAALFKKACSLRTMGMPLEEAEQAVHILNQELCEVPVDEAEVVSIVSSAFRYDVKKANLSCTDMGNGSRLLQLEGGDIAFVPELQRFMHWDALKWHFDRDGRMMRMAKCVPDLIQMEADQAWKEHQDELRKALVRHGYISQSLGKLKAMVEIIKSDIPVFQSRLDADDFLLGVGNGVVNLKAGEIQEPSRDDYITKSCNVSFDGEAECPTWLSFLSVVMQGDTEMVEYLQKMTGYILSGSCDEQCMFFLFGHGANGKSTFVNVLSHIMGDYASQLNSQALMVQPGNNTGPNPELARLRGARLAVANELEEGARISEPLLKGLTGQDPIACRELYQQTFEYLPNFKLVMVGNHKPHIRGTDLGIWRRIRLVGFNASIPEADRDPGLHAKLIAESAGILNWAIAGCLKWQRHGLTMPAKMKRDTYGYQQEQDLVESWLDECCQKLDDDTAGFVSCTGLYCSFSEWAKSSGEWEMTKRRLTQKLVEKGFKAHRRSSGRGFMGLALGAGASYSYTIGEEPVGAGYTL